MGEWLAVWGRVGSGLVGQVVGRLAWWVGWWACMGLLQRTFIQSERVFVTAE